MTDHVHDLALVREATERLLSAAGKLDDAAVAEASRLPDWTRGHVLAHLARNADALVNVLAGRPMYASAEVRDADIARDAGRTLDVHLADLRAGAARFTEAAEAPGDPDRTVELRNGVTDSAARIPFRRLVEVELHHVDLGIGYELADLPGEFTARAIGYLAARYSGHPGVPAVTLAAADGARWRTGAAEGAPVAVPGTAPALLGWLSGRGARGADLTAAGAPLPALPPL